MNDNLDHIEDLFRDGLENLESDVDPNIWENISSQISGGPNVSDPSSGSSSTSLGGVSSSVVKMALVAGAAGVISIGAYYFTADGEAGLAPAKQEVVVEEVEPAAEKVTKEINIPIEEQKLTEVIVPLEQPIESIPESVKPTKESVVDAGSGLNEKMIQKASSVTAVVKVEKESVAEKTPPVAEVIEPQSKSKKEVVEVQTNEPTEEEALVLVEPSIRASVKKGQFPLTVEFQNVGTQAEDVYWKFGAESEFVGGSFLEHTFEKSGEYWVSMRIRDERGQFYKDSTLIKVEGKYMLSIPNVITPNGDGYNDYLNIETDYIQSMNCKIHNRNGSIVAFWMGLEEQWDGRDMSGNVVENGTYFIIVEAIDMDGQQVIKKSVVTVTK